MNKSKTNLLPIITGTKINNRMVYRSLGILSSAEGLSMVFAEFHENGGRWTVEPVAASIYSGGTVSSLIGDFIEKNGLSFRVAMITLHTETGGTVFSGASIAAATALPVITDLPAIDLELGGNGAFYSFAAQKLGLEDKLPGVEARTICVAWMGILRWREEYNFLSYHTGASRSSIGGALWTGQEA